MSIMLKGNKYVETMQGMCYSDQMLSTKLEAEMSEIEHFGSIYFSVAFYYLSLWLL